MVRHGCGLIESTVRDEGTSSATTPSCPSTHIPPGLAVDFVFPLYPALLLVPRLAQSFQWGGEVYLDYFVFGVGVLTELIIR